MFPTCDFDFEVNIFSCVEFGEYSHLRAMHDGDRAEQILTLLSSKDASHQICVLYANRLDEPFPKHLRFVHGESLHKFAERTSPSYDYIFACQKSQSSVNQTRES